MNLVSDSRYMPIQVQKGDQFGNRYVDDCGVIKLMGLVCEMLGLHVTVVWHSGRAFDVGSPPPPLRAGPARAPAPRLRRHHLHRYPPQTNPEHYNRTTCHSSQLQDLTYRYSPGNRRQNRKYIQLNLHESRYKTNPVIIALSCTVRSASEFS